MVYLIDYQRKNVGKMGVQPEIVSTTFISKETDVLRVIGRFESMHKDRLSVVNCELRQQWQLDRVDDLEYTQYRYCVYVYISWDTNTDSVRLDVMSVPSGLEPLQSFIGTANNVRKHAVRWLSDNAGHAAAIGLGFNQLSPEHISYIGYELARCDAERIDYVQD